MESYICKYSAYEKVGQDDPVRSAYDNIMYVSHVTIAKSLLYTYMKAIQIRDCISEMTDNIPYISIIYE